ncbi:MAG: mRNA surveillance protein Pelota [Thaumarchaeota archaeon]|nr:mRNA surveillance protein Pelota [Nitrososphaerota archaeon]MCL5317687.1 mRNA surveillance protein Pelota [Nitrososphaerota archaeon]
MIIHRLVPKAGLVVLTPEDAEDLWVIRRIVSAGDLVSGETTRVVKEVGDYVRPDKGERISVSITLRVEQVSLDSALERLRVLGEIISTSNEMVSKGASHSLAVTPMKKIGLKKEHLGPLELSLLKKDKGEETGFLLVAIDRREAGLGLVKGVHLQIFPTVHSGFSGKFYREASKPLEPYFKKVAETAESFFQPGRAVYVFGPGTTRNEFVNYLGKNGSPLAASAQVVEGVDSTGDDGIYVALHSKNLREKIEGSRLGKAAEMLEEMLRRVAVGDERLAIGFKDAAAAADAGAVESLLVSDRIFELGVEEENVIRLLNMVEGRRGTAFLIDPSTDLGVQVSKLGGVVALLRYPVKFSSR